MSDLALVWDPMGSSQDYLLGWCSLGWAIGVTVLYRLIIGLDRFGCWCWCCSRKVCIGMVCNVKKKSGMEIDWNLVCSGLVWSGLLWSALSRQIVQGRRQLVSSLLRVIILLCSGEKVEMGGIDPPASRMLSERSTI